MRAEVQYGPEGSQNEEKLEAVSWVAVRRLGAFAAPYWRPLAVGGVLMLLAAGVNLSLPLVARAALDQVVAAKSLSALDRLAVLIVALILVSAAISFGQYVLVSFTGQRIVADVRTKLFSHLMRLPVAYFDRTRSGDLASRLSNDVSLIQTTLTSDIVNLVANVVTLVGGIVVAVVIDWRLTLVVVGLLAVMMLVFVVTGRALRRLNRQGLDALSEAMGMMTEALANVRLVKAFAQERQEDERAGSRLSVVLRYGLRTSVWEAAMGTVAFVGFILLLLGVVWYGGRGVIQGTTTAGNLLAFFITVTIIAGPMGSLASLYTRLQRAVGASDRLFEILDEPAEPADGPDAGPFPDGPGEVAFRRLSFRYADDVPVLDELDLTLPAGKVTALVGASGGGKTTLASLLYRFYEPRGGEITIDGVPLARIRRDDLRGHVGIVPQTPVLFAGTIRENIRYGRLDATDAEIEAAAQAANVAEFVQSLPDGYDTRVGERGVTLSGGQNQRVAIARALLKDPRILILDEATSALDTKSEALVKEALDRLMQGRTTLVIAHRLTTIQSADQIAVLDAGRIVECGTHLELVARGGRYADLHNIGEGDPTSILDTGGSASPSLGE